MTEIVYKTGDATEGPEALLLHGCNAQGAMGSGIAKAIREKFPEAFLEYRKVYSLNSGLILGEVITVECSEGKIIANGITQEFYGRDEKQYVSYDAINKVMEEVNRYAIEFNIDTVAMPLIGAGLGGGSWKIISKIIEDTLIDVKPIVYTLDGKIPTN